MADLGRGVLLRGTVWPGGAAEPFDGAVLVDAQGTVARLGPDPGDVPSDLRVLGGDGCWVGPGIIDTHVHLAFGDLASCLPAGVVAVRDLGAPPADALRWRSGEAVPAPGQPVVAVAGPVLTAPGGYPSQSWGAGGFASFIGSAEQARAAVRRAVADGADVVKIALEPGGADWPVPCIEVVRAVVAAAHDAGRAVVAHALRAAMVRRALEGGVDELAHTPTDPLGKDLIGRIAAAGIAVVSTLQTFFSGDDVSEPAHAAANAAALHRAGVELRYGTDLGNVGTMTGVDVRELERLADTGLGRAGALRAATERAARAPGIRRRTGVLRIGDPAALVLLASDPLVEPAVWRAPIAVVADGRLVMSDA